MIELRTRRACGGSQFASRRGSTASCSAAGAYSTTTITRACCARPRNWSTRLRTSSETTSTTTAHPAASTCIHRWRAMRPAFSQSQDMADPHRLAARPGEVAVAATLAHNPRNGRFLGRPQRRSLTRYSARTRAGDSVASCTRATLRLEGCFAYARFVSTSASPGAAWTMSSTVAGAPSAPYRTSCRANA